MSKVVTMGSLAEVSFKHIPHLPGFLQREEIAAQIIAIMQAKFYRPDVDEMRAILKCVEGQLIGMFPES